MKGYHIKGGKTLCGEVCVSGAKNAALPILAASVMTRGENLLLSCPQISDVDSMINILKALGCKITRDGEMVSIAADGIQDCRIPDHMMKEMRSSVFLAGSLLARCGEAVISNPGGCDIGQRPIDIHIAGLRRLGAHIRQTDEQIVIKAGKLKGADIRLSYPSVGATENLMLAAISAEGITRIENSAREPEIVDLQNYINCCGGCVSGAGSGTIVVEGGTKLQGCRYGILPDRIEAGTYLLMALATGGEILLNGISRDYLDALLCILEDGGYRIRCDDSKIWAKSGGFERISRRIRTAPYPGFPTDLQPQMTAFLTKNGEGSVIEENIFEKRLEYAKELKKMDADIEIFEKQVIIKNNHILCGAHVEAKDLRGGAALIIAGLMADGHTDIANTKYIKRGYSRPIEKIRALGGEIIEHEG